MLKRALLVCLAVVGCSAQELIDPAQGDRVGTILDLVAEHSREAPRLDCDVDPIHVFLDFSFRFEAGYTISCPIRIFDGRQSVLRTFLRVRPTGSRPFILSRAYNVPAIPPELRERVDLSKVKAEISASGGFFVREGAYDADLLVVDERGRIYRRSWRVVAARSRSESEVRLAELPDAVIPLSGGWSCLKSTPGPIRLTILVNAAPTNPYALKLRAWDRAMLLGSVGSVMNAVPAKSVRLVAFNVDQQQEIFRQDRFTIAQIPDLSRVMENLELGVISYRKLSRVDDAREFLAALANEEISADERSDVVVFVGPSLRFDSPFPKLKFETDAGVPKFYDIVYYPSFMRGGEFPDVIQRLTSAASGRVERVHSPADLGRALRRILDTLSGDGLSARRE